MKQTWQTPFWFSAQNINFDLIEQTCSDDLSTVAEVCHPALDSPCESAAGVGLTINPVRDFGLNNVFYSCSDKIQTHKQLKGTLI